MVHMVIVMVEVMVTVMEVMVIHMEVKVKVMKNNILATIQIWKVNIFLEWAVCF